MPGAKSMKPAKGLAGVRSSSQHRGARKRGRGSIGDLRLLVIVDATNASRRALEYAGRILAHRLGIDCHLAYIAPHLPPELLESGGSELPECEEAIESYLRRDQRRWTAVADRKANRVLRAARAALQRAGVPAARIHTRVSSPLDIRSAADEVLLMARDEGCRTVVVGHTAHTWLRGLGGGHLAEQLVRRAKGFAVWVID
jgi:nucleotide-binding universal stress UspA family protein